MTVNVVDDLVVLAGTCGVDEAEPLLAAHTPAAGHAHARIDAWENAVGWIEGRLAEGPAGA